MKAMILGEPRPARDGPLAMTELEPPRPADDEIVVGVSACGVCRTDLHIVTGEIVPPSLPIVPGHQAVGRVIEVGARAGPWRVGDRAGVAWVGRFCGICDSCVEGRENLCEAPLFTGYHRHGGFAERIAVPGAFAHPIPERLGDDAHAAPLLCAGIIGYRALKRSELVPGARLALYGFGAAAHIAIQIARAWGCEVYVVSRDEESRRRAGDMGAAWTGGPGEDLPRPVDSAVDFAPAGAVIPGALANLRPGGTLAIAGIYVDRIPELDYDRHLFRERRLVSVTANTRSDARELLSIAARIGVRTDVATFPLEQANDALARLADGDLGAQAAVLLVHPGRGARR